MRELEKHISQKKENKAKVMLNLPTILTASCRDGQSLRLGQHLLLTGNHQDR